jgi:predicted pyridoxine 5'-phosphate oxidase superfamily flavin-nucleotide-binding protein
MNLPPQVKTSIDKSVLCWLATASADGTPNVSPKEIFTYFEENSIIIANIASPQTVKNIKQNEKVCISFMDIFVQKGFQIKGNAEIIGKKEEGFEAMEKILTTMTAGKFPFATITKITVEQVKPIIAPRYMLYPETTEEEQIESAKRTYGV